MASFCLSPSFNGLKCRDVEGSSMPLELVNVIDSVGTLTLELSTDDIEKVIEVPADSWLSLAGNIVGNIGMCFGFSVFRLRPSRCSLQYFFS